MWSYRDLSAVTKGDIQGLAELGSFRLDNSKCQRDMILTGSRCSRVLIVIRFGKPFILQPSLDGHCTGNGLGHILFSLSCIASQC